MADALAREHRATIRAVILGSLLVGPLIGGELWARHQLDLLYPYLMASRFHQQVDTKLMLLERAGCPELLALGSSQTNRALANLESSDRVLELGGKPKALGSFFSFGINGGRATLMYGIWRRIRALGCTPPYLVVEASPTIVNGARASLENYAAVLDASTVWKLPSGFSAEIGLDTKALLDHGTLGRLVLHRLRGVIVDAVSSRPGSSRRQLDARAFSGLTDPLSRKVLGGERIDAERQKRTRWSREGKYSFRVGAVEMAALQKLVAEASAAGVEVLLHSPPVSEIYRQTLRNNPGISEFVPRLDVFAERIEREIPGAKISWLRCYEGDYDFQYFSDWIHLNVLGSKRYADELFAALRGQRSEAGHCSRESNH